MPNDKGDHRHSHAAVSFSAIIFVGFMRTTTELIRL
jgi:hypothetical protein